MCVTKVKKRAKKSGRSVQEPLVDPSSTNNLVGFFALLLEIDRRNNPHLYRKQGHEQTNA